MPIVRFGSDNLYEAPATALTASSSAASLPVGATQSPDRHSIWRATAGTGAESIDIDLGDVRQVSMVAVAEVQLKTGGALKLQHRGDGSSPGTAVDVVTLPTSHERTRVAAAVFSAVSHRHWRLLWTDPQGSSVQAELGYAYLGVPLELPDSLDRDLAIEPVDPSVRTASADGQGTRTIRSQYLSGRLRLMLSAAERDQVLDTVYRQIGAHRPTFAWIDSDEDWTAILLELGADPRMRPAQWGHHYLVDLPFQEAR